MDGSACRRFAQVPYEQDAAAVLFGEARQSVQDWPRFVRAVRVHLRAEIGLDWVYDHEARFGLLECIPQKWHIGEPNAAPIGSLTVAYD